LSVTKTHYVSLNDKLYKVLKRNDAILSIKECDILFKNDLIASNVKDLSRLRA